MIIGIISYIHTYIYTYIRVNVYSLSYICIFQEVLNGWYGMPIVTPDLRVQSAACRKCWRINICMYVYISIVYIYINSNILQIDYMYIIYLYICIIYVPTRSLLQASPTFFPTSTGFTMPGTTSSPPSPRSRAAVRQPLPRQRPPRRLPEAPTVGTCRVYIPPENYNGWHLKIYMCVVNV